MAKLKRGPFSKAEEYYILGHRDDTPTETIAADLVRSKDQVEKFLKKNPKKEGRLTVGDQFARQSGATIMTENASSMADQQKAGYTRPRPTCVTEIKKGD